MFCVKGIFNREMLFSFLICQVSVVAARTVVAKRLKSLL